MRAQFFMDARDYWKYSLLDDLMRSRFLDKLTLVWMLTPDVPNGHGRRKPTLTQSRKELNAFFAERAETTLADVPGFFRERGYSCHSYGDSPPHYLTRGNRSEYFEQILDTHLRRALVFVDPDNGVEPASGSSTAHIRMAEIQGLWARMTDSLLLVYQHKPRVVAEVYWPKVARRLFDVVSAPVSWLPCGDMGFVLVGSREILESASKNVQELGQLQSLTTQY